MEGVDESTELWRHPPLSIVSAHFEVMYIIPSQIESKFEIIKNPFELVN